MLIKKDLVRRKGHISFFSSSLHELIAPGFLDKWHSGKKREKTQSSGIVCYRVGFFYATSANMRPKKSVLHEQYLLAR